MVMSDLTTIDFNTLGFLRLPDVLRLIPVSKSTWWQGVKDGRYPKPVKLGPNTTAWRVRDLMAMVDGLERQQQAAEAAMG